MIVSDKRVLILVVMEMMQNQERRQVYNLSNQCFNPCYNGNKVELHHDSSKEQSKKSFNPCCNGNDVEQLINTMFRCQLVIECVVINA